MPEPLPRPRPGERFADPGARVAFEAIRALEVGLQHAVLSELRRLLALPDLEPKDARRACAIAALREASAELERQEDDRLLSVRVYRELFAEFGRERGWPPDGTLRRWLGGSWNDALRQAYLPVVPDGDAFVAEMSGVISREECIQALLDYSGEKRVAVVVYWRYIQWARRPDVVARPGRRPRSQSPFDRHFGSWLGGLRAAGLMRDEADTSEGAPRLHPLVAGDQHLEGSVAVFGRSGYGYRDEQLLAAIVEIATRHGEQRLRTVDYARLRIAIQREEAEAGFVPRAIPSLPCIQGRFGTWDAALEAAGVSDGVAQDPDEGDNQGELRAA